MKKLIELLNEYEPGNLPITKISGQGIDLVISKRYGFIKWLVDNDKIDRTLREDIRYPYYLEKGGLLQGYEKSDEIIMLLSISSSPIEDLISYLK